MNIDIQITRGSNFAGWEAGSYNPSANVGTSTLVAGPNCEKLKSIFDKPPARNRLHYLFILDNGQLVANAQVNVVQGVYKMRLALSRISKLYTSMVQGEVQPKVEFEPVWLCQSEYSSAEEMLKLDDFKPDMIGYREERKAFLQAALAKALEPRDSQRLFWGEPRKSSQDMS